MPAPGRQKFPGLILTLSTTAAAAIAAAGLKMNVGHQRHIDHGAHASDIFSFAGALRGEPYDLSAGTGYTSDLGNGRFGVHRRSGGHRLDHHRRAGSHTDFSACDHFAAVAAAVIYQIHRH